MATKYEESRQIEQQIIDLLAPKNSGEEFTAEYLKFIKPVDAFITFEEEDGKIVADSFEHQEKDTIPKFLNEPLDFIEATEPTNIIWENRHYNDIHYAKATIKVVAIIICLLIVSFITIYFFKASAIAKSRIYPNIKGNDVVRLYQNPSNNYKDNSNMKLLYEHGY